MCVCLCVRERESAFVCLCVFALSIDCIFSFFTAFPSSSYLVLLFVQIYHIIFKKYFEMVIISVRRIALTIVYYVL
jgi:hypothetical protein